MTKGEERVRVSFNPEPIDMVSVLKSKSAELIDLVEDCDKSHPEQYRLAALAQTAYEEAAMWAVKLVTYK